MSEKRGLERTNNPDLHSGAHQLAEKVRNENLESFKPDAPKAGGNDIKVDSSQGPERKKPDDFSKMTAPDGAIQMPDLFKQGVKDQHQAADRLFDSSKGRTDAENQNAFKNVETVRDFERGGAEQGMMEKLGNSGKLDPATTEIVDRMHNPAFRSAADDYKNSYENQP